MLRKIFLTWTGVFAVLSGALNPNIAHSATIVQTKSFESFGGFQGGFWLDIISPSPVNESFGRLTSTRLEMEGSATVSASWDATDFVDDYGSLILYTSWFGSAVNFYTDHYVDGNSIDTDSISVSNYSSTELMDHSRLIARGDVGNFYEKIEFSEFSEITDPLVLQNYNSNSVDIYQVFSPFSVWTECLSLQCADIKHDLSGQLILNVKTTYIFEPMSVPELSTWLMLLIGFAFSGAALRRARYLERRAIA